MTATLFSIAPIFLIIVLGHIIRRTGILDESFWQHADKLVYWVLMPALLFHYVSVTEVSWLAIQKYTLAILGGFFTASILALGVSKLLGYGPELASSILQGSARHNSFIALAIAAKLWGAEGVAIVTIGVAILIPATNIVVVSTMVSTIPQKNRKQTDALFITIIKSLFTNPIFLSIIVGLGFGALRLGEVPILHSSVKMLGSGAMPLVLLTIGANIRIKQFAAAPVPIISSSLIKLFVFPLVSVAIATALALSPLEIAALLLLGAVPAAVSSYTLAAQLGGDQQAIGAILTTQTLVSFLTIPLLLAVLT